MLENYPMRFDNDDVIIHSVKYEGTPSLYKLMFRRPSVKYDRKEEICIYLQTY